MHGLSRVRWRFAPLTVTFPLTSQPTRARFIEVATSWSLRTQRESYGKTTGEWLRRLRANEATIREKWGDKVYDDYERYLDTCVRAFDAHWSSDVQLKLRWCG